MKFVWIHIISALTGEIYWLKRKLSNLNIFSTIAVLAVIILLEIILAVISLPLYLTRNYFIHPTLFNQEGFAYCIFRVRKRVALSSFFSIILLLVVQALFSLYTITHAPPTLAAVITWDNGGADNNWSTAENWSTDTVPTSVDDVVFDNTTTTDSNIDAGFPGIVASITINSGYTGTITQSRAVTTTGNFFIADGVYDAGSAALDIDGDFSLTGGTFIASSATTSIADDFTFTGGTFNHANGTLSFDGAGSSDDATVATLASDLEVSNLTINKTAAGAFFSHHALNNTYDFIVTGTLYLKDGSVHGFDGDSQGTVLQASSTLIIDPTFSGGLGMVYVTGTARTITLSEGVNVPRLDIFNGSTIDLSGTATTTFNTIVIHNGIVNANNANVAVTYTLNANGTNAVYNGGPGNEYIPGGLIYGQGSVDFGEGFVESGGVYIYNNAALNAGDVSFWDINFYAGMGDPVIRVNTGAVLIFPTTTLYFEGPTFIHGADGTINNNNGTFVYDGTDLAFTGSAVSTTFNNFTVQAADAAVTLTLPTAVTTTFAGILAIAGSNGAIVSIQSDLSGTAALIDAQATSTISYMSVIDINNVGTIITGDGLTTEDLGNNTGFSNLYDSTAPTPPGSLSIASVGITNAVLSFGDQAADANFGDYIIYYAPNASDINTSTDSAITSTTDGNLAFIDYAGAPTTTISNLASSTRYVARIYGFDIYGNAAPSAEYSFYTLAAVPLSVTASDMDSISMLISWDTNGNGVEDTEYRIEDVNGAVVPSEWVKGTSYRVRNLTPDTSYTFKVKARNGNLIETDYAVMSSSAATLASYGGGGPPPPPPPPPSPPPPSGDGDGDADNTDVNAQEDVDTQEGDINDQEDNVDTQDDGADADIEDEGADQQEDTTEEEAADETADNGILDNDGSVLDSNVDDEDAPILENEDGENENNEESDGVNGNDAVSEDGNDKQGRLFADAGANDKDSGEGLDKAVSSADETGEGNRTNAADSAANMGGGGSSALLNRLDDVVLSGSAAYRGTNSKNTKARFTGIITKGFTKQITKIEKTGIVLDPEMQKYMKSAEAFLASIEISIRESAAGAAASSIGGGARRAAGVTVGIVKQTASDIGTAARMVSKAADNPKVERIAKKVVAPASAGVSTIAMAPIIMQSAVPLFRFLFLQPLLFLGIRRRKSWGVVYNSANKLPVDLATVRLVEVETNQIMQSRVTDRKGRYFFTTKPGLYRLEVNKPGFVFPSRVLRGVYSDGRRLDIYHGDSLNVEEGSNIITPNIPIDPQNVHKTPKRVIFEKYVRKTQRALSMLGIATTGIAFYVTPSWQVGGFLALHVFINVLAVKYTKPSNPKRLGLIYDKQTNKPVTKAVIRLYTQKYNRLVDTQVTNNKGQYAFLAGPNVYYLTVQKEGLDEYKSGPIIIDDPDSGFVAMDIGI